MYFAEKQNIAKKGAVNAAPFFAVRKRKNTSNKNLSETWERA